MDAQVALTLIAIMLAVGYFGWSAYRTWLASKTGGCGGGCGCSKSAAATSQSKPVLIPSEQLTMRVR